MIPKIRPRPPLHSAYENSLDLAASPTLIEIVLVVMTITTKQDLTKSGGDLSKYQHVRPLRWSMSKTDSAPTQLIGGANDNHFPMETNHVEYPLPKPR